MPPKKKPVGFRNKRPPPPPKRRSPSPPKRPSTPPSIPKRSSSLSFGQPPKRTASLQEQTIRFGFRGIREFKNFLRAIASETKMGDIFDIIDEDDNRLSFKRIESRRGVAEFPFVIEFRAKLGKESSEITNVSFKTDLGEYLNKLLKPLREKGAKKDVWEGSEKSTIKKALDHVENVSEILDAYRAYQRKHPKKDVDFKDLASLVKKKRSIKEGRLRRELKRKNESVRDLKAKIGKASGKQRLRLQLQWKKIRNDISSIVRWLKGIAINNQYQEGRKRGLNKKLGVSWINRGSSEEKYRIHCAFKTIEQFEKFCNKVKNGEDIFGLIHDKKIVEDWEMMQWNAPYHNSEINKKGHLFLIGLNPVVINKEYVTKDVKGICKLKKGAKIKFSNETTKVSFIANIFHKIKLFFERDKKRNGGKRAFSLGHYNSRMTIDDALEFAKDIKEELGKDYIYEGAQEELNKIKSSKLDEKLKKVENLIGQLGLEKKRTSVFKRGKVKSKELKGLKELEKAKGDFVKSFNDLFGSVHFFYHFYHAQDYDTAKSEFEGKKAELQMAEKANQAISSWKRPSKRNSYKP